MAFIEDTWTAQAMHKSEENSTYLPLALHLSAKELSLLGRKIDGIKKHRKLRYRKVTDYRR